MKPASPVRGGFAMVIVLLTLLALLVLCAPFLMSARNADQSSARHAHRGRLELALDSAARLAEARLGATHPALDATPYHDSLDELRVDCVFPGEGFLDPYDAAGTMFDLESYDVSGRIDLNSAPPQALANLIGGAAVTVAAVDPADTTLALSTTAGFLPQGFVWMAGELIGYSGVEGNTLTGLVRGLGAELTGEGKACGPRPPLSADANTLVLDQRAYAIAEWRLAGAGAELRTFDAIEELRRSAELCMAEELGQDAYDELAEQASVYPGVGAGRAWQHGTRLQNDLTAGEDCRLRLGSARWFNEGTTVRIRQGAISELGIVRAAGTGNEIELLLPVANDYDAFRATVEPLARRPVNVNSATPAVLRALLSNLQMRGRQSRLTPREAELLAGVIVESRPFTSFEDFVRRLVLPAAGWETLPADAPRVPEAFRVAPGTPAAEGAASIRLIDEDDARALYKNAQNANDAELAFSTLPFAFVSTDVHALELRAAVNAPSGVERARGVREEVRQVVPQRDLLSVVTRQEDFEELFRLSCDAAGWASGPFSTSRFDPSYGSSPPTRSRAHLGVRDTMPADDPLTTGYDYVFAARDEEERPGFAMPWVARVAEIGKSVGRTLHFDDETRELEGRYLPEGREVFAASDATVGWLDSRGLMRPFSFSLWVKAAELEQGALFLDAGGAYGDADRVSLTIDDGDLVLRVLDAAGDHSETTFEELAEARYELAPGNGPGMPLETWMHVQAEVRGSRPDQIALFVDGSARGEVRGQTRLTASLSPDVGTIPVETTEGFPNPCVLRIGDELIEATVAGPTAFDATYAASGANAGFGGRLARERFSGVDPGLPLGLGVTPTYASGTPVQLYGYALAIDGNVPAGQGALASNIGPFAVGRVTGMQAEGDFEGAENIAVSVGIVQFSLGFGLERQTKALLELTPADPDMPPEELMQAFDPSGGYAVLMSVTPNLRITDSTTGSSYEPVLTTDQVRIGGIEVVHYAGYEGNVLRVDQRGDAVNLPSLQGLSEDQQAVLGGKGAFVFDWSDFLYTTVAGQQVSPDERLVWQTKIFPISLRVQGAQSLLGQTGVARFAQITRQGAEAGLTEWVRYDDNTGTDLVRDDPQDLEETWFYVQGGILEEDGEGETDSTPGGSGTGGPGGGGGGGGGGPAPPPAGLLVPPPAAPAGAAPPAAPAVDGAYWHYRMGEEETADYAVTRAVRTHLQFRGVLGTYDHAHPAGAAVLPVWQTFDEGVDAGYPGRFDAVTLIDSDPSNPGTVGIVHHAHRPLQHTVFGWSEDPADMLVPVASEGATDTSGLSGVYVALSGPVSLPMAGGASATAGAGALLDSRFVTRVSKFPSGELPRSITSVALGGAFGAATGVPAATVDEVVFGNLEFSGVEPTQGGQMLLSAPLDAAAEDLRVAPDTLRIPRGRVQVQGARFLDDWPEDAGVLRIGDELLVYQSYDSLSGTVILAPGGRGFLGTDPGPHAAGEAVSWIESLEVALLAGDVAASAAELELNSIQGFPGQGLVRIGDELVHYTWIDGLSLGMPRASTEPGAADGGGAGIFRGRFGTSPAGHGPLTPVLKHPFRYADRWADKADAPELEYLGVSLSQPGAVWRGVFFEVENPPTSGLGLRVLQRTDPSAPWDADPGAEKRLAVLTEGMPGGQANPIGAQADPIEWRVHVRYEPGAFDPDQGLSHGWKATVRLTLFGAEYLGPGMLLRRVAR